MVKKMPITTSSKKYICLTCKHEFNARKDHLRKPRQCSVCSSILIIEKDIYSNTFEKVKKMQFNSSHFPLISSIDNVIQANISSESKVKVVNDLLSEVKKKYQID